MEEVNVELMPVDKALQMADFWSQGTTFYPGMEGWRVVCAVLAAEVRRLRAEHFDEEATHG